MDVILKYIESMFVGVPVTDETKRLREELTANMSDKYDELIADGKSVNEAVGTVIGEFGSIEEVLAEMGIERDIDKAKKVSVPALFRKRYLAGLIMRPLAAAFYALALWSLSGLWHWYSLLYLGFPDLEQGAVFYSVIGAVLAAITGFIYRAYRKKPDIFSHDQHTGLERISKTLAGTRRIVGIAAAGAVIVFALRAVLVLDYMIMPVMAITCIWFVYDSYVRGKLRLLDMARGIETRHESVMRVTRRLALPALISAVCRQMWYLRNFDGGDPEKYRIYMIHFLPVAVMIYIVITLTAYFIDKILERDI